MSFIDLTSKRFGKLTVISLVDKSKRMWLCKCDCGRQVMVRSYNLKRGPMKSCGKGRCNNRIKDLTGKKFGKLYVLSFDKTMSGASYWKCKCECGKQVVVRALNLKKGNTKSCGDGLCSGRIKDLTGKKFGKLNVLSFDKTISGAAYWKCKCECGKIKRLKGVSLIAGATSSCGSRHCMGLIRNLVGQKFNQLVVIGFSHTDKGHNSYWKCKCSCGRVVSVQGSHLLCGTTKTCGNILCNKKYKNIKNKRFGKLVALSPFVKNKKFYWKCKCDCGETVSFLSCRLLCGDAISCGCMPKNPKLKNEQRLCSILSEIFPHYQIKRNHPIPELYNKVTHRHQRIDIAVYSGGKLIFAIEYDGEQHFYPVNFGGITDEQAMSAHNKTKIWDKTKSKVLKRIGIPLIRFSYKDRSRRKDISKNIVIKRLTQHGILIGDKQK